MSTSSPHGLTRIVKDTLVIRVSTRVLAFATENHPNFWDIEKDVPRIKVTNRKQWAKAVRDALEREEEDGSTIITAALDKAVAYAVEQGEEGIEFLDELSSEC